MQIELIEFEFGLTQNVGDYSNVRPSLKLVARLTEDDDPKAAIDELTSQAIDRVWAIVDDELEQAGREVKYSLEQLYKVRYSSLRQCVVLFPASMKLPEEKTWRETDHWGRPGHVDRAHPDRMRIQLAQYVATIEAQQRGYEMV